MFLGLPLLDKELAKVQCGTILSILSEPFVLSKTKSPRNFVPLWPLASEVTRTLGKATLDFGLLKLNAGIIVYGRYSIEIDRVASTKKFCNL